VVTRGQTVVLAFLKALQEGRKTNAFPQKDTGNYPHYFPLIKP